MQVTLEMNHKNVHTPSLQKLLCRSRNTSELSESCWKFAEGASNQISVLSVQMFHLLDCLEQGAAGQLVGDGETDNSEHGDPAHKNDTFARCHPLQAPYTRIKNTSDMNYERNINV